MTMQNLSDLTVTDFLAGMPEHDKKHWIEKIVERMIIAFEVSNRTELAAKLNVHKNTPTGWITKNTVPWRFLYHCSLSTEKSLDWLCNGKKTPLQMSDKLASQLSENIEQVLNMSVDMKLINEGQSGGLGSATKGIFNNIKKVLESDLD